MRQSRFRPRPPGRHTSLICPPGSVVARSLLVAPRGVQLNGTRLDEALLVELKNQAEQGVAQGTQLAAQAAQLAAQATQLARLAALADSQAAVIAQLVATTTSPPPPGPSPSPPPGPPPPRPSPPPPSPSPPQPPRPPPPPSPPPPSPPTFTCAAGNDATQCAALRDLYFATNGPSWTTKTGWTAAVAGGATDYCTFYRVMCTGNNVVYLCVPRGSAGRGGSRARC